MITQKAGVKQDQSLIKGIKGMGMQTDVLYLMIVNSDVNDKSPMSFPVEDMGYDIMDVASTE
ncbi:hypothetical protein N431DRAFT_468168 [Stipitochalara longipes BDJ]|nr:hypothetical protein N431DRAFT_468168 [Stipitochalara longipes BDJ]